MLHQRKIDVRNFVKNKRKKLSNFIFLLSRSPMQETGKKFQNRNTTTFFMTLCEEESLVPLRHLKPTIPRQESLFGKQKPVA
jgi:hypothetical protein